MKTFENKVVVITGSSSGIGKSVAMAFAKEGAKVVVNSRKNTKGGDSLVESIKKMGGNAIHIQKNLAIENDVKDFFCEIVQYYKTVDILINNAGRTIPQKIDDANKQHWYEVLDDNLISTVLCSKEVIKIFKKTETGAIINTSSIRGIDHTGREGIMAYSAAKAAINNFTRTLAKELAPNITVNAVAPGFINTPYLDGVSDEMKLQWLSLIPIKKFIDPDDLAKAYLFLAACPFITGTILVADGGFTLKMG